jgi:mannose-6-phosphate isomerase-like protein (cupin superfamily)
MSDTIQFPHLHVINLATEGAASTESYRNVVINRVNESCLRLAAFEVEYRWHFHPDSDELFIVVDGVLEIDFVDAPTLRLEVWDMITIPAGTVHRTRARGRTVNLTFEHLGAATVFVEDPSPLPRP